MRPLCLACLLCCTLMVSGGCQRWNDRFLFEPDPQYYQSFATEIEYPDVETRMEPGIVESRDPRALENPRQQQVWNLTLAEAVQIALANSQVIRNLGGSVAQSVFDPAISESDPQAGVEAALSAFDTQFLTNAFWTRNDRGVNQTFAGLFLPTFQQLNHNLVIQLSKTAATGGRLAARHHMLYNRDANLIRNPSNRFPSVYEIDYEVEYRQPLLQGAGVGFNRIAGPTATAGFAGFRGVLLARINSDISLTQFEAGVTNLVSQVEDAYWELYFAYRDLETKLAGRDSALVTWQDAAERARLGLRGGEPENEAQARAQYYRFHSIVQTALSGSVGLYAREDNLRYLMGLPPNQEQLIRPADEPTTSKLLFHWGELLNEAFIRRVELREQKWLIKRRELELLAARNYLRPRLDGVALYRWRGIGDTLIGPREPGGFANAYQNLTSGDFQEWQLGVEFVAPLGFRREVAGVRNAELRLARERAVLDNQELTVTHELSAAVRELKRAFELIQTTFNQRVASRYEVSAIQASYELGRTSIDVLLRAQQRLAEADIEYYRAVVDYNIAVKNVHVRKGSLLEYDGVYLAEGPWSPAAQQDASWRARQFALRARDFRLIKPGLISIGPYQRAAGQPLDAAESGEAIDAPPATPDQLPLMPPRRIRVVPDPLQDP